MSFRHLEMIWNPELPEKNSDLKEQIQKSKLKHHVIWKLKDDISF